MRIKIKQTKQHCRAGIDSGLGRQHLHVIVGVLWVRLPAENEAGSFQSRGANLAVVHTTYFPQILQPSFSLTSLRDVTCRNKDTHRYTEQLSWLQRGRHPGQSAAPAHSHPKNCRESNELPMEVTTPQICHFQGKGTRKSLSIPQTLATHYYDVTLNILGDIRMQYIKICTVFYLL